jgi:hypothetical protein
LGGFAAAGLGLAAGLAASGAARASAARRGRRSPAGAAFAGLTIAWTLVTGLAGVALLLAGTVTRHVYMGRNLNLAVVNPLALVVLAVAAIAFAVRRDDARRRWSARAARAAGLLAVLSAAGALAMLVPRVGQASWDIFALALPANLAMWWGFRAASEAWRARGPAARP